MAILVLLFFTLTTIFFLLPKHREVRESLLKSSLITFFLILLSTEILSLFNRVTYDWVNYTWILFNGLAIIFLILNSLKYKDNFEKLKLFPIGKKKSNTKALYFVCLIVVFIASTITLIIALKSPPNNFDSMTYHMARIPHWIQNQNIRYYPTAIARQNYSTPLAEFSILHLQLLSKSDYYANLVQWFSFIISILTTSLIAKELKIGPRGQWITAALTAALPMAILQSTSTQNDLVVGLFCLSFFYFLRKSVNDQKWDDVLFASLAMGLALATKGTAYVYCAAIGLAIGGYHLIGKKIAQIKEYAFRYTIIILIALTLNTGIFLRNWDLYHHPLITSNERIIVEEISPGILFSNLVRNGVSHLVTPFAAGNDILLNGVTALLGSQINNPASTFQGSSFELTFRINETNSGNFLHFFVLTLLLFIFPWVKKGQITLYISIILAILFFSLAFRWQPWGARLQIPIFMLGSIVIGISIDSLLKKTYFPTLLIILFFITSTPFLLQNSNRPFMPPWNDKTFLEGKFMSRINEHIDQYPSLSWRYHAFLRMFYKGRSIWVTSRDELYFLSNYSFIHSYKEASHYLRNDPSREIGLIMDPNDWEYPLWVMLDQHASQGEWKINHILVDDISGKITNNFNSKPEILLITKDEYWDLPLLSFYEQVYESNTIQIMKKIQD